VRKAWETVAVKASVTPVVVGYPTKDLAMPELMEKVREQIAAAAGVPQTMLEDAANFATAKEHHQSFYSETIAPEVMWIESALNRQLFEPMRLHLQLDYQALDIFQRDEAERSESLLRLTQAGLPVDFAMELLGFDLPGDMEYDNLKDRLEDEADQRAERAARVAAQTAPQQNSREEMRKWERKALKALKSGKSADVEFVSDEIDDESRIIITDRLCIATTEQEVKAAFEPPFRTESITYP